MTSNPKGFERAREIRSIARDIPPRSREVYNKRERAKHDAIRAIKNSEIIEGYLAAEKPYAVFIHTTMGGYMEFCCLERGIMFEDNARMVCDKYAQSMTKSENFKGVCVRKDSQTIYEVTLK